MPTPLNAPLEEAAVTDKTVPADAKPLPASGLRRNKQGTTISTARRWATRKSRRPSNSWAGNSAVPHEEPARE